MAMKKYHYVITTIQGEVLMKSHSIFPIALALSMGAQYKARSIEANIPGYHRSNNITLVAAYE